MSQTPCSTLTLTDDGKLVSVLCAVQVITGHLVLVVQYSVETMTLNYM